jgi:hypothetical protein
MGNVGGRQREDDRDWLHLREHDNTRASGMDDVAGIDQANTGDAVKRRGNRGVAEFRIGIFDGRLVDLDDLLVLGDEGALVSACCCGAECCRSRRV